MKISILYIFLCCFAFASCGLFKQDATYYFKRMIEVKGINCFHSISLIGYKNSTINEYKAIYKEGIKNNKFLLEEAYSAKNSNYYLCEMSVRLTEGDLAIMLLLDINRISFTKLLPKRLVQNYNDDGASIWWDWIHSDIQNRIKVINQIQKELILLGAIY